ncbi:hypothetical protein DF3PA_130022 [Candidatus Defluviicoccus seviourii]|uniref:Uncharacterized protein n=2 Tax=root TaxID=1 RepID=A0A564WDF3_9PROT|nr:hypothetical protein DF3PB_70002 [uncultured Defluviicoccus sp.]VUX45524.1 hypothetical protein DF3PA_130022 [Candidatus Defluviicoccus seviourii]
MASNLKTKEMEFSERDPERPVIATASAAKREANQSWVTP